MDEWCPPIPQVAGPREGGDLSRASWLTGAELSFEPRLPGSRVHVPFVHSACMMNNCSMSGTALDAGDPAVTSKVKKFGHVIGLHGRGCVGGSRKGVHLGGRGAIHCTCP